jgi:hypothetical protein
MTYTQGNPFGTAAKYIIGLVDSVRHIYVIDKNYAEA